MRVTSGYNLAGLITEMQINMLKLFKLLGSVRNTLRQVVPQRKNGDPGIIICAGQMSNLDPAPIQSGGKAGQLSRQVAALVPGWLGHRKILMGLLGGFCGYWDEPKHSTFGPTCHNVKK